MNEWDPFFNKSVQVRRYSSLIENLDESDEEYDLIYPSLACAIMGEGSDTESTMAGFIGLANFKLVFRESDIDEAKGWPQHRDVVYLNSQPYWVNKMAEHIHVPGLMTLPPHKVAYVGKSLTEIPVP